MSTGRLDPGRPPRKRSSFCRFCICIGLTTSGLFLALITYGIGSALSINIGHMTHSRLYQNETLAQIANRGSVVQPLVDENQVFDIAVSVWVQEALDGRSWASTETPLYSDTVFRGLRLADKHKSANITYKLPLSVFKRTMLRETDLRASFVLIPTSPSLMDHVTDFSTWRPESVGVRPVRTWPFPLGADANLTAQTVVDKAIDSFGISFPLLEFHEIGSRCAGPATSSKEAATVTVVPKQTDEDEDDDEEEQLVPAPAGISNMLRYPKHAFKRHPEISIPEENRTEWAYAPYMGHHTGAAGPKDLISLPVTRENCSDVENLDPDSIDVTWHLSYSGRSPLKYFASSGIMRFGAKRVGYKKSQAHDTAELWNGLAGHRFHPDAHPRRRLAVRTLSAILYSIETVLTLSYWYTRTSTVGISVLGTVLLALSDILTALAGCSDGLEKQQPGHSPPERFIFVCMMGMMLCFVLLWPLCMLKTAFRLSFDWSTSWFPSMRRHAPNHLERTSQRLDARTSWVLKLGTCIILILLDYTLSPFDYHLLSPRHPARGDSDWDLNRSRPFIPIYLATWYPLKLTGIASQILLNHRAGTFAGMYRLALGVRCAYEAMQGFRYLEFVVGRYDARPGLSVLSVLNWVMFGVLAWQAFVFPKVELKMEEED